MSFLAPSALALGLLAIPIILLYLLRLRRRDQTVSSTLLWRDLVLDRAANAPWQKLQRNILLLLQLLILAALVLALARPIIRSTSHVDGNLTILLDASASMTATDGGDGSSRFEQAINQAGELIGSLGSDDAVTLIAVGRTPEVVVAATTDDRQLRSALESITPDYNEADWAGAFALAAGLSQNSDDPQIVVISDGALPRDLPALPGEVTFLPVGTAGDNLAISAQGVRPSSEATDVLVSVTNYGPSTGDALVNLYIDDALYDSRPIEVPSQDSAHLTWTLPEGASVVESRITPAEGSADFLPADNQSWSLVNPEEVKHVLINSDGNLFIERLFNLLPGYEVINATEDPAESTLEDPRGYDLYVYDGVAVPNPLPDGNVLIFDPQPSGESADSLPTIAVSNTFTNTAIIRYAGDQRLEDVDWGDVHIAEAREVTAGALVPLIESAGGPLLLAGELDGRHVAVFPFDLAASDLPLQIAFPIIMANITEWLNPGRVFATHDDVQPGAVVTLVPDPRAEAILVESPSGDIWEQPVSESSAAYLFADTGLLGIYTVSFRDNSGQIVPGGRFVVNLVGASESDITPASSLQVGNVEIPANGVKTAHLELWPFLLGVGLLLLMIEWWLTYRRNIHFKRLRFR